MESSEEIFKIHKDETIENQTVVLDYHAFQNCTIKGCTVIYGGGPCKLIDSTIGDCNFVFRDAALRALQIHQIVLGRPAGVDSQGNINF